MKSWAYAAVAAVEAVELDAIVDTQPKLQISLVDRMAEEQRGLSDQAGRVFRSMLTLPGGITPC